MKCLVCGKVYEGVECPRCHFPDVQLMGDQKSALEKLMPTIQEYRSQFLSTVKVELLVYRGKDRDGRVVQGREERMLIGTAAELQNDGKWLTTKFARIPEQKAVRVTLRITAEGESRDVGLSVPNLHRPELQKLGARLDETLGLRVLLRNATQQPTESEPIPLFPG